MSRKLSLSQAARMIGVTRKDMQHKIQGNELRVMEGYVLLDDLKKAFPDAQYEDNTILEKMQKIMADAVHKMAESEKEGSQIEALSKRAYFLNKELSEQKAKADFYEELVNNLKLKFIDISTQSVDKSQVIKLQQWLADETYEIQRDLQQTSHSIMEAQLQQFMHPHVRLLPSRHDFISDKSETLLESALHVGLGVDYGCNNGQCGKCKMKLISGKVEKVKHTDYVLSQEEKLQNTILSCSHRAVSDVVLETSEAVSADDIPLQKIDTKIKSIDTSHTNTAILNLKTPRSQRLRFLAGQAMTISFSDDADISEKLKLSIASCPCDDMNIQFHIPSDTTFMQQLLTQNTKKTTIAIEGPDGFFNLDEQSQNTLVFIAQDNGFSVVKSLIEHALASDLSEHIHLYWIVKKEDDFYMKNICRSWNDALDNFHFHPVIADTMQIAEKEICNNINQLNTIEECDYYLAGTNDLIKQFKTSLLERKCNLNQIYTKVIN